MNHMTTPDSMSIHEAHCDLDKKIARREAEIEYDLWCKDCECPTLGEDKHRYHNTVPMFVCLCGEEYFNETSAFNCCASEDIKR